MLSHVVNIVNVWTLAAEYLTKPLTNRLTCVNLTTFCLLGSFDEIYAGHRRVRAARFSCGIPLIKKPRVKNVPYKRYTYYKVNTSIYI